MKIKFITITCEKYHETRVKSIRDSWGNQQDVVFLSDFNQSPDIVGFSYLPRGYENIWMKYVELLRNWTDFDKDWYFFTDDDTFVNIQNVKKLLSNYKPDELLCLGHIGLLNPDGTDMDGQQTGFPLFTIRGRNTQLPLSYVSGGAGFILSNLALKSICEYMKMINVYDIPGSYNSDVTFGFWLRNANIKIIDIKGFWWTNPSNLNHSDGEISESYTYHYIDQDLMIELHKKSINKSSIYFNNQITDLNNEEFYYEGLESTLKSLEICKSINQPVDEKFNIFVYWIGDNVNYKHSVVIKSFLATQNLENATLKIYSDKDISTKEVFHRYKNFKQVEFHIFDVEKEIIGTGYENFRYSKDIKNHYYNPAYESDFFRLLMLHKYGGFYIDFDILLLRDLSPLLKYDFLYQWGAYPNNMINGAIMHLRKNSRVNNLFTYTLTRRDSRPGIGSLYWASELYLLVKSYSPELVIFPASFFNPEWQSNCHVNLGYMIDPMKKHEYSNMLYEGCFTWHWHNRWQEKIEEGSKFNILDNLLEDLFVKKFL